MIMSQEFQILIYHGGGRGGIHKSFTNFPFKLKYVSFEPGDEEIELDTNSSSSHLLEVIHVKEALGRNHNVQKNLKIYNQKDLSSMFDINHKVSNRYKYQNITLESEVMIPVTTIDAHSKLSDDQVDFIVLDTQGSELDILKGADATLKTVLGIRVEINFIDLYPNSPLFFEVCQFLYGEGFYLVRLERPGSPTVGPATDAGAFSLNWDDAAPFSSDAIFIKDRILDYVKSNNPRVNSEVFAKFIFFLHLNNAHSVALDYINKAIEQDIFTALLDDMSLEVAKHVLKLSLIQLKKLTVSTEWQKNSAILSLYKKERSNLDSYIVDYSKKRQGMDLNYGSV